MFGWRQGHIRLAPGAAFGWRQGPAFGWRQGPHRLAPGHDAAGWQGTRGRGAQPVHVPEDAAGLHGLRTPAEDTGSEATAAAFAFLLIEPRTRSRDQRV
jgi:hypothetical protein